MHLPSLTPSSHYPIPLARPLSPSIAVFRSAVDSWAIQQLFPIVPIHRLDEEPTVPATLADLTCDSDGKVDRFINPKVGGASAGQVMG